MILLVNNKKTLNYFVLACFSALSGCVSIGPARTVMGENSSGLKIINESKYVEAKLVTFSSGDDCNMSDMHALVAAPLDNDRLKPSKTYNTRIPAGQTFSVRNYVYDTGVSCRITVSFMPVAGKDYILHVDARAGRCLLGVERLESTGVGSSPLAVPEFSVRQRDDLTGALHGGALCTK